MVEVVVLVLLYKMDADPEVDTGNVVDGERRGGALSSPLGTMEVSRPCSKLRIPTVRIVLSVSQLTKVISLRFATGGFSPGLVGFETIDVGMLTCSGFSTLKPGRAMAL